MELITYGIYFKEEEFKPARGSKDRFYINKPEGGLWCSPVKSEWGWKDWCMSEDYKIELLKFGTKFRLKEDAKLLTIDSYSDLIRTLQKYGKEGKILSTRQKFIDFDAIIADGYDGMYLTEEGNNQCHLPLNGPKWASDLNCWDCESLVLFNKKVIQDITYE